MAYCDDHTAHVEHFDRLDARVDELEDHDFEKTQIIARMDAILTQLQKLYWICLTAVIGCLVTALFSVLTR